jgi:uncharacterized protein (DUF111 family)
MPTMTPTAIGYGAADSDPDDWPNVLRLFLARPSAREGRELDTILQVETNLDDVNPQTYEHVMEQLFAQGALDATLTPVIMKRGRPGIVVTCLVAPEYLDCKRIAERTGRPVKDVMEEAMVAFAQRKAVRSKDLL